MLLKDFINKYSYEENSCFNEYTYKCKYNKDDGFILPESFYILNNISRLPLFIVAVNRDERAILIFNGEVTLYIYTNEVQMNDALSRHKEYVEDQFERFNLKNFCDSIITYNHLEIMDTILDELYKTDHIKNNKKIKNYNRKKKTYHDDLMILLRLYMNTSFPKNEVRIDFINDAYNLLRKLEGSLISVQNMNLVKIAEVYFSNSDETYYVLKKDYEYAYKYISYDIEETKKLLQNKCWSRFGRLQRWDDVLVEAFMKDRQIIAIYDDII